MRKEELANFQLEQLEMFKRLLKEKHIPRTRENFERVVEWIRDFPRTLKSFDRENLRTVVCNAFDMTQEELDAELIGAQESLPKSKLTADVSLAVRQEQELSDLLPGEGLLRRYINYTSHSEAPLAYHVLSFLCIVGNILNRRVWFNMGYYKVYPTLGILILGPSGIKKTSATNIAVGLLQEVGLTKIYSEKLTPEALIDAMRGENAVGLIYAPEMAVFLNKQQYNEGLVQLITRFMDCPDVWESGTIGRGKSALRNIGISSLMCSTLDWFVSSTPADSFGGGFVARNLLVVQNSSARSEPIPNPGDDFVRRPLVEGLSELHSMSGEVIFTQQALDHYKDWYNNDHQYEMKNLEHDLLATYHNRKPDHAKRLAIALHFATHPSYEICDGCFTTALNLLNWLEQFLPDMLRQMFKSQTGEASSQILRLIKSEQPMPHATLIRKMTYQLSAMEVRNVINSLKEARLIKETADNIGHYYEILGDEE